LESRFLCYIRGGQPIGTTKSYQGSTDQTLPIKNKPIRIPYELYFSKQSSIWENKGVAFIKSEKNEAIETFGRMYLITKDQFVSVVRQENSYAPEDLSITIDFETTISNGASEIPAKWYDKILYLGLEDGYPIFTFTSNCLQDKITLSQPGEKYLSIIIKGIKETYDLPDENIINYLMNLEGIKGMLTSKHISDLVRTI
jgi:hypothetical protein